MMKPPRKSPQTRKRYELALDHHSSSQHGLRKDWARMKSPEVRSERHTVTVRARQVLAEASDPSGRDDLELHVAVRRALRPRKDTLASVGERVRRSLAARTVWQVGYCRYFSKPYDTAGHREPFRAFLRTIMSGGTPHSTSLAAYYLTCLTSTDTWGVAARTARFLRAFEADDPAAFSAFLLWARRVATP